MPQTPDINSTQSSEDRVEVSLALPLVPIAPQIDETLDIRRLLFPDEYFGNYFPTEVSRDLPVVPYVPEIEETLDLRRRPIPNKYFGQYFPVGPIVHEYIVPPPIMDAKTYRQILIGVIVLGVMWMCVAGYQENKKKK